MPNDANVRVIKIEDTHTTDENDVYRTYSNHDAEELMAEEANKLYASGWKLMTVYRKGEAVIGWFTNYGT